MDSKVLPDDIVLKNAYYWAERLMCPAVSFKELVSVGYLVGKPLKDPRLLKDWIHYTMLHFIENEYKKRAEAKSDIIDAFSLLTKTEKKDYTDLYKALKTSKLSKREHQCIQFYFFENKKQKTISLLLKIDQRTVAKYIKRALEKIQKTLETIRK